ncbi:MAG: alpha/beta hydrolase [Corynebacterium sp.]|uniref:alpha/beta hydrolase n=1 Tax=Corynebacterium sp. TaxID=1720 RepID=UPI0026DD2CB0|nr:alpha/beta hydrolase [Corynebacterium sp.]MDO5029867.1 alpha/beta hydrolase [Corynebacterium sp.]
MVTLAEALLWRADGLRRLADVLRSSARALTGSADESHTALHSIPEQDFSGDNRRAADDAVRRSTTRLRRSGVSLERLSDCCRDTAALLDDVIRELKSAVTMATDMGFQVDMISGAVTPAAGLLETLARSATHPVPTAGIWTFGEWRMTCEQRIQAALAKLNSLDEKAAETITALAPTGMTVAGDGRGASGIAPLAALNPEMAKAAKAHGLPPGVLLESSPGHSAIAFGDVDRAKTVITLVPGTSSAAETAEKQFERVAATFRASGEDPQDVAVVLFSYDAPPNLEAAMQPGYYDMAAERLQHLQSGLVERANDEDNGHTATANFSAEGNGRTIRPTQQHIVAGYSYGATVVSQASVGSGLYADRVLLIASPGTGPGLDRASDIKLLNPEGIPRPRHENSHRVAVATSPLDPIKIPAKVGIHGKDPADNDFGAYLLDLSSRGISGETVTDFLGTPVRDIPNKFGYLVGNPHIEHYFDDEVFTRETSTWLRRVN